MARFTLPRDLYHGKGALEALKSFTGKKAMICVGGGSMKRFGFLDRAVEYLKEAGMEVELFEGIEPDPSVETVMRGAEAMLKFEPDWIIAMGGGSPIDAAKAMWIKYEYPEITFEEMCKVFGIPPLRRKAHFCAISSTSGTATEVTAFSIITDYQKGIKYPIADFEITPDVAIVDPDLAETMPKKLVAHTGMDAMTHAVEAYVSTAHCDYTDPLAIFAIRMIQGDLVDSYNGDMSKRDSMHNAQCLAGMAFSNALLGIVGTVFSGWLSDTLFHGRRNVLAFGFGVLNTVALCLFLYSGDGILVNMLSMVLFGMAIGVLICFLGGLMAIDIVPREATGAALGIVGMASYIGAGLQDIVSGWLINEGKTVVDGVARYDFEAAALFWIAASALSFILALCVSKLSLIHISEPTRPY